MFVFSLVCTALSRILLARSLICLQFFPFCICIQAIELSNMFVMASHASHRCGQSKEEIEMHDPHLQSLDPCRRCL